MQKFFYVLVQGLLFIPLEKVEAQETFPFEKPSTLSEQELLEQHFGRRLARKIKLRELPPSRIIPGRIYTRGSVVPEPLISSDVDTSAPRTVINADGLADRVNRRQEAKRKIRAARKAARKKEEFK